MRKNYVKPAIISEEFVPQTYCAVCEHTESGAGMYKFVCDAGGGVSGDLFDKDGNNLTGPGDKYSSYSACGTTHEAATTDEFIEGYFYPNKGNDNTNGYTPTPVIIWLEPLKGWFGNSYDIHATTNLDRDTWEKNIS